MPDSHIDSRSAATSSAPSRALLPLARTRTRTIHPPERYRQEVAFIAQSWDNIWEIQDYEIQEAMSDPIAFAATSNPDMMYLHKALRAPDRNEFIEAMKQEVKAHKDMKHWELVATVAMVHETQASHQYPSSLQVESTSQRTWWQADQECALLGDLQSSSEVVLHLTLPHARSY